MKSKTHIFLLSALAMLMVACKEKEVDFSYSPEEPRAGASILFTNHTAEGETWEWNFGDGTTATTKSPSKVYKRSGTYTVVLTVDKKNSRRCSKTLTVVDTIPQIVLSDDSLVHFMTPVRLKMSAYNPYSYQKTYNWNLDSAYIKLLDGKLTDEVITVLFLQHNKDLKVDCNLTIGETTYRCSQSFFVHDTLAPALCMKDAGGSVYYQRTFLLGEEEPRLCGSELPDRRISNLLRSATCTYYKGQLYWAEGSSLYHEPVGLWTDVTHLGYGLTAGQTITGLAWYNNICMIAYGTGIYRFRESDIDKNTASEVGAILTDIAVKGFTVDSIGKKIYYVTSEGLNICNISGENPRLLVSHADCKALCVDNVMNRIFWAQPDGVWYMPLVQSPNNATTEKPVRMNTLIVETLATDPTPRMCFTSH